MKNRIPFLISAMMTLTLTALQSLAQSIYEPYTFTTLAGLAGSPFADYPFSNLGSLAENRANGDGTGGEVRFSHPSGVKGARTGNVYVADNNTIRKITPAGVVTTLAGLAGVFGNADGTESDARFSDPSDVAVDSAGNV